MICSSSRTCGSLLLVVVCVLGVLTPATAETEHGRKKKSMTFTLMGIGFVAGGVAVSVLEYAKARDTYDEYQRSAFTGNTEKLRRKVKRHDRNTLIGAFTAGLGAFTIMVNF